MIGPGINLNMITDLVLGSSFIMISGLALCLNLIKMMSRTHEDNRPSPILNSYQHGKPVFRSDISVCPEAEHFSRDQLNIVKPCAPPAAPPANTTAPQLDDNESQRSFERCEHVFTALDSHNDVSSELTKTHLRAELATVKRLEAETLLFC